MNKDQMGMAIAGLLISVATLYRLRKLNLLSETEIDQIINLSTDMINHPGFPADKETLAAVSQTLKTAKQAINASRLPAGWLVFPTA
jgi:hypothetical protein